MQPLTSGNPNQTPQVHALSFSLSLYFSISLSISMAPLNTNTCTHTDHSHQTITITGFEIKQVFLQIHHSFDDILNFYGV